MHLKNSGGIGQPRNRISPNSINKKSIRKKKKKTKLASKFPPLNQLALFTLMCLFVRRQRRNADNSVVVVLVCFILSIGQQHHTHTFCCIAFRFFPFDLKVERPKQRLKILKIKNCNKKCVAYHSTQNVTHPKFVRVHHVIFEKSRSAHFFFGFSFSFFFFEQHQKTFFLSK